MTAGHGWCHHDRRRRRCSSPAVEAPVPWKSFLRPRCRQQTYHLSAAAPAPWGSPVHPRCRQQTYHHHAEARVRWESSLRADTLDCRAAEDDVVAGLDVDVSVSVTAGCWVSLSSWSAVERSTSTSCWTSDDELLQPNIHSHTHTH